MLQIVEPVIHGFHWPDAVLSYAVALAVGFPIVVSLAWIFDVSAAGIERAAPSPSLRGGRLAALLVGIGALAAAPGTAWLPVTGSVGPPSALAHAPSNELLKRNTRVNSADGMKQHKAV